MSYEAIPPTGSGLASGTTGELITWDTSGDPTTVPVGTVGQALLSNGAGATPTFQTLPGGGDALTANPLSQFAPTTSAQLRGVLSDETGSGAAVFATSPTLATPVLGVAAATSINKVAITAPAAAATLTIADGATLTAPATASVSGTNTGDQTNIAGNAATVTTNANLTGPVTSVGNATTIADPELAAIAGLTSAADRLPYFTGSGTAALATFTAAGRSMAAAADAAAQTALLDAVTSGAKGLAPASGGGTANFLRADGSWAAPPGGASGPTLPGFEFVEHFFILRTGAPNYLINFGGAGATGTGNNGLSTAAHPGIGRLQTGTDTTGYATYACNDATMKLGGGVWTLTAFVAIDTISDGTNTFVCRVGLSSAGEGNNLTASDQIVFRADASANWDCVTRKAGAETVTDSGVAVTASSNVDTSGLKLEIVINAAGTSVDFKINGSTVATHTTNIPLTSTGLTWFVNILKSAGTTNREFLIDYLRVKFEP